PILGMMREDEALRGACENHAVIPGGGAAAQGRKADIARPAGAGDAVAAARRMILERDAAAGRYGLAEHQGGAGWRVDLGLVVHLQNFDIKAFVKRLRDALDQ